MLVDRSCLCSDRYVYHSFNLLILLHFPHRYTCQQRYWTKFILLFRYTVLQLNLNLVHFNQPYNRLVLSSLHECMTEGYKQQPRKTGRLSRRHQQRTLPMHTLLRWTIGQLDTEQVSRQSFLSRYAQSTCARTEPYRQLVIVSNFLSIIRAKTNQEHYYGTYVTFLARSNRFHLVHSCAYTQELSQL